MITLVLGVDRPHLELFKMVWANWMLHKPSLGKLPVVVFTDDVKVTGEIGRVIGTDSSKVVVHWDPDVEYVDDGSKWTNLQRQKMLAGFVHVPAKWVVTDYWLKLDLDVVATGKNIWIDPEWFERKPAIIAHPWGYTKPANQMIELDIKVGGKLAQMPDCIWDRPPLDIFPQQGSRLVRHQRICSWCAIFNTKFTEMCSNMAEILSGPDALPVPSQDGFMWYVAKRADRLIIRTNMKRRGWRLFSSSSKAMDYLKEKGYNGSERTEGRSSYTGGDTQGL